MGLVLFKDILKTVELANITKNQIDTYNAQSDPDPKIRLLANNRKICHDKLSKEIPMISKQYSYDDDGYNYTFIKNDLIGLQLTNED